MNRELPFLAQRCRDDRGKEFLGLPGDTDQPEILGLFEARSIGSRIVCPVGAEVFIRPNSLGRIKKETVSL